MQHKKRILSALLILLLAPLTALSGDDFQDTTTLNYSWGSARINGLLWGIASGDVNGDGIPEIIVLESNALWIGRIDGDNLTKTAYTKLPELVQGLRIFTSDLNDDGREEAVISAVSNGGPASLIMKFNDDGFGTLASNIAWHVRTMSRNGRKMIIGQRSTPDDFFTGKIYELKLTDGKIVRGDPLPLPRWADIFNFAYSSADDGSEIIIRLNGYEPIMAYELRGTKWKRFWSSSGRYGGTLRYVILSERPPLQDLPVYDVSVDREPTVTMIEGHPAIVAARHDMPVRNMIGSRQIIKGGQIMVLTSDKSLGFTERMATKRLPGFIADYCIDTARGNGAKRLLAVVQNDAGVLKEGSQSVLMIFDLKN